MSNDRELQQDVLDELEWDPHLKAGHIGVAAEDGVITLTGTVASYDERVRAEKAARRVKGVVGIANDVQVDLPAGSVRTDTDIALAAVQSLAWNVGVPSDGVKVTVRNGWVTLDGEVDWNVQRVAAEKAVRRMVGVRGVTNLVTLRPQITTANLRARIEKALRRHAEVDAQHIAVTVDGTRVRLTGTVRSWVEREDAEAAAWAAPGVTRVENRIHVEHDAPVVL